MIRSLPILFLLLIGLLIGCGRHPGTWNQAEIEKELKDRLSLSEVELTGSGEKGYQGKGKNAEGETYKLEITQFPDKKRMEYKAESDRGDFRSGNVEFK